MLRYNPCSQVLILLEMDASEEALCPKCRETPKVYGRVARK
jgi:phage FluMu protein Com